MHILHQIFCFEIWLYLQPPNSPDLNVLDLRVFAALQTLQWKKQTKIVDEMVERVEQVFANWPKEKSNNVFLTLQTCMNKILDANGDNNYKIVHTKRRFWRDRDYCPC